MIGGLSRELGVNRDHSARFICQTLVGVVQMGQMHLAENYVFGVFVVDAIAGGTAEQKVCPQGSVLSLTPSRVIKFFVRTLCMMKGEWVVTIN